jgi:hypothetical protein
MAGVEQMLGQSTSGEVRLGVARVGCGASLPGPGRVGQGQGAEMESGSTSPSG